MTLKLQLDSFSYSIQPQSILNKTSSKVAFFNGISSRLYQKINLSVTDYSDTILQVAPNFNETWAALNSVLVKGIKGIVANYFTDERIRATYNFPSELEKILEFAKETPFEIGMFRPDFVIEEETLQPKICEIGARYPINGWMVSYYSQQILSEIYEKENLPFESISSQLKFPEVLMSKFNKDIELVLLHNKEPGTEVFGLLRIFEANGFKILSASPAELTLDEFGQVLCKGIPVSQFIMEMDRLELLGFDLEVLKSMVQNGFCLNDVRTLILVHDKRILSILSNKSVMTRFLNENEYAFLEKFLIPSYGLDDTSIKNMIHSDSNEWIFKKNSGGRGIDMFLKSDFKGGDLETFLEEEGADYMAQLFVKQALFPAPEPTIFVGMLLFLNNSSFGHGIFRGGQSGIINVKDQRAKLFAGSHPKQSN